MAISITELNKKEKELNVKYSGLSMGYRLGLDGTGLRFILTHTDEERAERYKQVDDLKIECDKIWQQLQQTRLHIRLKKKYS